MFDSSPSYRYLNKPELAKDADKQINKDLCYYDISYGSQVLHGKCMLFLDGRKEALLILHPLFATRKIGNPSIPKNIMIFDPLRWRQRLASCAFGATEQTQR